MPDSIIRNELVITIQLNFRVIGLEQKHLKPGEWWDPAMASQCYGPKMTTTITKQNY